MSKISSRHTLSVEVLESRDTPAGFSPEVADNISTGLYHQILHREPDATGLASFVDQLTNGVSVETVVNSFWDSVEFHTQEVNNYYQVYLGRVPTTTESSGWVQRLVSGTPEAAIMTNFLTSAEYTSQHPLNADYVTALYQVLLDRVPDQADLDNNVAALNSGTPPATIVQNILNSSEFHQDRIESLYTALLGRPADAAGLQSNLAHWNQPGVTIRDVETGFLYSPENVSNLSNLVGASLASPLVTEYQLNYAYGNPSTHEILEDPSHPGQFFITGQLHDTVVVFDSNTGQTRDFALPVGAGPHGMLFDDAGRFFVSFEFMGKVAQLDPNTGSVLEMIDVRLNDVPGAPLPINTSPHDIALGADGRTIWFTGKATGTVGKINPDGTVNHYQLPTGGSVPIYLALGPDGNIWGTELVGNKILRVTPTGTVTEFSIPTFNSRPIVIIPDPTGRPLMWFSEESGHKVASISMTGVISEFAVPRTQRNSILAGLAFDEAGNLYTQSYVDQNNPVPSGPDFIVKLSSNILTAPAGDTSNVPLTRYQVPSEGTVFHRITLGSDGNMYFTELALDKVGRLLVGTASTTPPTYSFNFGL